MSPHLFNVGASTNVEILPSPTLFRVNFSHRFIRGLEDGAFITEPQHAIVTIDEATGAFSCQSGFMDFAYTWPPSRRDGDIFSFLASLDFEYFMEKACKSPWKIFDLDRTISYHREEIRTERRGRRQSTELSVEVANQRWDALTVIEKARPDDEANFMLLWERHAALRDWSVDYPPALYTKIAPRAQAFWDQIWTTLVQSPQFHSHKRLPKAA
jgi:hypothetical protein